LIDLFLQGAPERLAQIGESFKNPAPLAFHAQALRSMSLNLGAARMVTLSQQLEDLALSGDLAEAPSLLRDLETALAQTKGQLLSLRDQ
jgi:hypothetical protein